MLDVAYLGLATLLSLLGMVWLALSMDVHWAQVQQIALAESRPPKAVLKGLGYLAISVSLVICLFADRPSIAVLVWIMLLVGAAFTVAFVLAKKPGLVRIFWPFKV